MKLKPERGLVVLGFYDVGAFGFNIFSNIWDKSVGWVPDLVTIGVKDEPQSHEKFAGVLVECTGKIV